MLYKIKKKKKRHVRKNDNDNERKIFHHPANTSCCFDVVLTSFERYGRQMDVETTLCAYWAVSRYFALNNNV